MSSHSRYRIFDMHHHLETPKVLPDGTYDPQAVDADLAARVKQMERAGITASVIMTANRYDRPNGVEDTRKLNDYVAWYRDHHRERFPVAVGSIEPTHGVDAGIAEINRMATDLHMDGVVWHQLFNGGQMDSPRMIVFAKEIARLGMVAFLHLGAPGNENPTYFEPLAMAVPECTFVGLVAINPQKSLHDMRLIAEHCPNLYLETSKAYPLAQPVARFAQLLGSTRIVFGSDMHARDLWIFPPDLRDILDTDRLDEEAKQNILWDNAERLFPAIQGIE